MRSALKQRSGKGRKFWGNPIIKIIDMDNRNLRFLHKQSLSETYLGKSQIGKTMGGGNSKDSTNQDYDDFVLH